MGAEEKAETLVEGVKTLGSVFGPSVLEKLDAGWTLTERGSDGQLFLVPPPPYGDSE